VKQYVAPVIAALATSAVIFIVGFMYEGHRMRAVVTVKIEALTEAVKQLSDRVHALELKK
jgi:uncharacterized protein YqgV (UPF0045/DUF77 family)